MDWLTSCPALQALIEMVFTQGLHFGLSLSVSELNGFKQFNEFIFSFIISFNSAMPKKGQTGSKGHPGRRGRVGRREYHRPGRDRQHLLHHVLRDSRCLQGQSHTFLGDKRVKECKRSNDAKNLGKMLS